MKENLLNNRLRGHVTRCLAVMATWLLLTIGTSPALAAPCTTNCLTPGDYTSSLSVGGSTRTFLIHVPSQYSNASATALLLDLHAYNNDASYQKSISGQLAQSNQRGFIAVWPQGLNNSWNGYKCCGSSLGTVDDVGFLRAVIANLKTRANIAAGRVFVTGLSNGGSMTHRMACEAADVVTAAAPVSYTLNVAAADCRPSRAIPLVEFHGTNDELIYYNGSAFAPSAQESLSRWKQVDGCVGNPYVVNLASGSYAQTYTACRSYVYTGLVTVWGGKHYLYSNGNVDIAAYIWNYVFVQ